METNSRTGWTRGNWRIGATAIRSSLDRFQARPKWETPFQTMSTLTHSLNAMIRLLVAALILGTLLNIAGWIGNAIVLKPLWTQAAETAPQAATVFEPRWLRELLTLVSDYVFAVVACCIYRIGTAGWQGSRIGLAIVASALTWLAAVPMTYLAFIMAGYLPIGVSVATSLWALATFLIFAPALPYLVRSRPSAMP